MVNRRDLQRLANSKSFSRGQSYYRSGCVIDTVKKGNNFEATVMGSDDYDVSIKTDGSEIIGYSCSCPYDWGGICKHIVALGLAIIDKKYTVVSYTNAQTPQEKVIEQVIITEFFDDVYLAAPEAIRYSFLKQLFNKDSDLQSQFRNFVKATQNNKGKQETILSLVDIDALRDEIYGELTNMVFNYDTLEGNFTQYDYYVEEHEATYDAAINMLEEEIFTPYQKMALDYIQKGNLLDALCVVLALYEGYYDVQEPEADDIDALGDYNNTLATLFEQTLKNLIDPFASAIKNEGTTKAMLNLFMERYQFYQSKYDAELAELEEDIIQIVYEIPVFEDFLLSLITSESIAKHLELLLRKNKLYNASTVQLFLEIAEESNNQDLWLQTAKDFAEEDPVITRQLMVKYKYLDEEKAFYKMAKMAFQKWPDKMDNYLLKNISSKVDTTFYVQVLEYSAQRSTDIEKYKELKNYWTAEQKEAFIAKNKELKNFYAQILGEEQQFAKLLAMTQTEKLVLAMPLNNVDNKYSNLSLPLLIKLLASHYPQQCFEMAAIKIDITLEGKRGRPLYKTITAFMQELKYIKGFEDKAKELATRTYSTYNRLPALRDEIRKAKVL